MAARRKKPNEHRFRMGDLPRIAFCPPSWEESKGKVDVTGEPGLFGRAFHEVMELSVTDPDAVDADAIARKHHVDPGELTRLVTWFGWQPRPGAIAELPLEIAAWEESKNDRVLLRGRLDVVEPQEADPNVWDLTDFKTTQRIEEDPEPENDPQTKAYSVAFLDANDEATEVHGFKAYARRGPNGWSSAFIVTREGNLPDVRGEVLEIAWEAVRQSKLPVPKRGYAMSHHCDWCPGRQTCPGVRQAFETAISMVDSDAKTAHLLDVNYETAPTLHQLRKMIEKAGKAIGVEVKRFVETFGAVEVEPGKFLAIVNRPKRHSYNEKNLLHAAGVVQNARNGKLDDPDATYVLEALADILAEIDSWPHKDESRLDVYNTAKLELAADDGLLIS